MENPELAANEILEEQNEFFTIRERLTFAGAKDEYVVEMSLGPIFSLTIVTSGRLALCGFNILSPCCKATVYGNEGESLCMACDTQTPIKYPLHSIHLHEGFIDRMTEVLLLTGYDSLEALAIAIEFNFLARSYWSQHQH